MFMFKTLHSSSWQYCRVFGIFESLSHRAGACFFFSERMCVTKIIATQIDFLQIFYSGLCNHRVIGWKGSLGGNLVLYSVWKRADLKDGCSCQI